MALEDRRDPFFDLGLHTSSKMPRATVLVLGDVGRSPRMQYHAHSLANLPDMEVCDAPTSFPRTMLLLVESTGRKC